MRLLLSLLFLDTWHHLGSSVFASSHIFDISLHPHLQCRFSAVGTCPECLVLFYEIIKKTGQQH